MACQENEAGRPASTSSIVVDAIDKGRVKASSVIMLVLHADKTQRERARETTQAWIPDKRADKGRCLPEPFGEARDVLGRPVQQSVARKEFTTADVIDRAE